MTCIEQHLGMGMRVQHNKPNFEILHNIEITNWACKLQAYTACTAWCPPILVTTINLSAAMSFESSEFNAMRIIKATFTSCSRFETEVEKHCRWPGLQCWTIVLTSCSNSTSAGNHLDLYWSLNLGLVTIARSC